MPANNVKADFDRPTFPQPPTDFEKYLYADPASKKLSVTSIALIVVFMVGSYGFVIRSPYVLGIYYTFAFLVFLSSLWSIYICLAAEKLDVLWRDYRNKWFISESGYCPTVDVYLPSAGEDLDLLDHCYFHISSMDYPNYKVWVLDDSGRDEVKLLASRYGFEYIRRPNLGEHKKAGNLRHAFPLTNGELILILDADMCPRKDMLDEMVWEFGDNPKIGILQTPQYFRVKKNQPTIEKGASLLQEMFYRVYQPACDKFGASICCGSNAMYRRAALEPNNGPALIELSEDVCTGLVVIRYGFTVKYVNVVLAAGLSPSTLRAFVNQLYRWSSGSYKTRFSSFLWNKGIPAHIKLLYFSSVIYFSTVALGVIGFGLPAILNLMFFPDNVWLENYVYIMPALMISVIVRKSWSVLYWDLSLVYNSFVLGYISLVGIWDFFISRELAAWVPTNKKRSKGSSYVRFIHCVRWIPQLGIALCAFGLARNFDALEPYSWVPPVSFWLGNFWMSRMVLKHAREEEEIDKVYQNIEAFNLEHSIKNHYSSLIKNESVYPDHRNLQ
jgi:cellulose synthase/poly-beta-1,6-N-acetylglucosamine synthase-like glycosyltransferase